MSIIVNIDDEISESDLVWIIPEEQKEIITKDDMCTLKCTCQD